MFSKNNLPLLSHWEFNTEYLTYLHVDIYSSILMLYVYSSN
jgi:hypothetical protein